MDFHFHHGHSHGHGHHHGFNAGSGRRLVLAIAVNTAYVAVEFLLGYHWGSVGLLADASHNLGDVAGLAISLAAFLLTRKRADSTFTYGFRKATVLAALANSVILLGAVALIIHESIVKLMHGSTVAGGAIMATAGIGMLVNELTTLLLAEGKEKDLNVKGS